MKNTQTITNDLVYVGVSDRRTALFENVYPIPRGVSYNSYLLLDEKTALFDTTDASVASQFFENVQAALAGRKLDYVVVHHMEPDHAATLMDLLLRHPEAIVVCTAKAAQMIEQFFGADISTINISTSKKATHCRLASTTSFSPWPPWCIGPR